MNSETVTEQSIKMLVNRFYGKIRKDPDLGPVFTRAIGTDDESWQPHLERMYAFWSSVMLSTGRYHGNPMRKHKELLPFDQKLFDQWLELFAETAHEVHGNQIAELYVDKSHRIAASLRQGLFYMN